MRNVFPVADLATVFLKNHFELRERLLRQTGPTFPFEVALNFGASPATSAAMHMSSSNGVLRLGFRDGERSFEITAPVAQLAADAAQLEVALSDHTGTRTERIAAPALASLSVPKEFSVLKDKVLKHLQNLFPAAVGKAKEPESGATVPETAPEQPAPAGDTSTKDEFTWYTVSRQGERDLKFRGKLLASRQSFPHRGRQFVFSVFETPSGKLVALKRGVSFWLGERDTLEVAVFSDREELASFFGYSPLAKVLYEDLGVKSEEVID